MKPEKLVIHTGGFLQKYNTHTPTISVLFWNKERKKEELRLKAFGYEYLEYILCTPAKEAPISQDKIPPHIQG